MVVGTALAAALCYALASVLQHRAARSENSPIMRASFLLALAARPSWLLGILADIAAFVFQVVALAHGSIVFVQPILASGLLFALPAGAALERKWLSLGDWIGATFVVAGLTLFLVEARPSSGYDLPAISGWIFIAAVTVLPAVVLLAIGAFLGDYNHPGVLAAAAGCLFGLVAALTKASADLAGDGLAHLAVSWEPYALAAVGTLGVLVGQSAFAAGPLSASLPLQSAIEPAVAVIVGAVGFGESLSISPGSLAMQVGGLALAITGLVMLGRSPLISGSPTDHPKEAG
jgi:drug/metabolite transporter (DMT)-like permease